MSAQQESAIGQLTAGDPIVWRADLERELGVCSETVRRWLRDDKLPRPDINPTRKTLGWRLSTLRAAGLCLAGKSHGAPT